MKTLITTFLLFFSITAFSQEIVRFKNEYQKGYFILVNGEHKPHGIWKSHYGKAKYNYGKMEWIKLNNSPKVTSDEIVITQLQSKVRRLENQLVSSNK
jgi:hypothetical protein